MTAVLEAILMGAFATYFMDIMAKAAVKAGLARPAIDASLVGRWALYTLRGKLFHRDIRQAPALPHEALAAHVSHYLIGIVLAWVYLAAESAFPAMRGSLLMPVAFGVATIVFPWLWLYPSIGFGLAASKSPRQADAVKLSIINHTDFGLGLLLWVVVFRRLVF